MPHYHPVPITCLVQTDSLLCDLVWRSRQQCGRIWRRSLLFRVRQRGTDEVIWASEICNFVPFDHHLSRLHLRLLCVLLLILSESSDQVKVLFAQALKDAFPSLQQDVRSQVHGCCNARLILVWHTVWFVSRRTQCNVWTAAPKSKRVQPESLATCERGQMGKVIRVIMFVAHPVFSNQRSWSRKATQSMALTSDGCYTLFCTHKDTSLDAYSAAYNTTYLYKYKCDYIDHIYSIL